MKKPFYITTTLPYVNSDPHIGFAMELIRVDVVARQKKIEGYDVFLNTGTDEHGLKIYRNAQGRSIDTQKYVDEYATKFKELIPALGIMQEINFVRTTDEHHVKAAQEFWKLVDKNGYIYKKNYSVKYCVGCELEKTESELVDGKCPLHPIQELETIEEENYFFKFSAFQEKLLELYSKNLENNDHTTFVIPESRLHEIRSFVERGIEDFSISRLASKMPWGIPVPGDEKQVIYVWFDALINYISAIGWPDDIVNDLKVDGSFDKWCRETGGMVQYCGKDNLRQQTAMWQAMLMAADLPPSKIIIINGFITGEGGLKMSKSIGNTVNPFELVKKYGTDALRYFVIRELHPFEDSAFTIEKFEEAYNAHLANGLGNLVSRVMKMATVNIIDFDEKLIEVVKKLPEVIVAYEEYADGFDEFNLQKSANAVWSLVSIADKIVQEREPFKKIKVDRENAIKDIQELLAFLDIIGNLLLPILPKTGETIIDLVKNGKMPEQPLFIRK
ncbi:MAG: methionine--tRNA ligase [Candidatus Paceibacterota bacterium]|jgi:methionyl-tRNA synthetase